MFFFIFAVWSCPSFTLASLFLLLLLAAGCWLASGRPPRTGPPRARTTRSRRSSGRLPSTRRPGEPFRQRKVAQGSPGMAGEECHSAWRQPQPQRHRQRRLILDHRLSSCHADAPSPAAAGGPPRRWRRRPTTFTYEASGGRRGALGAPWSGSAGACVGGGLGCCAQAEVPGALEGGGAAARPAAAAAALGTGPASRIGRSVRS